MIKVSNHRNYVRTSAMLLAATSCILPQAARAQAARPQVTVDVSVGAEYDSNPFLIPNGDSAGAATVTVTPKISWEDESSTAVIDSTFRLSEYSNGYGSDEAARIGAQASERVSERTTVFARAGFRTSRSSIRDSFFLDPTDPSGPGFVPEVPLTDVTIVGRRVRVNTLDASLGVDHVISPADSISVSASTSYTKFGNGAGSDYRSGFGTIQYRRRLSERTSVSVSANAGVADYINQAAGDATIISPQLGIEHQLDEKTSLAASAGVSFAAIDQGVGPRRNNTYAAGSFSVCNQETRSSLCATASRSAQPTAVGGISAVTSLNVNYDLRLSRKDRVALSSRYGRADRNSDPAFAAVRGRSEVYGVRAVYTRYINDRVYLNIIPSAVRFHEPLRRSDSNYSILATISVRLGKIA